MINKLLYALLLSIFVIGLPNTVNAERYDATITVDERERSYIVHLPDDVSVRNNIPIIFAFHPAIANGKFMEKTTELHMYGSEFIVVYPDGYRRTWHAGGKCCGKAYKQKIDDVGFFKAILQDLKNRYNVQEKVFLTGFSNGSIFTFHLICNHPEMIAAAVPFGATRNMEGCKTNTSIPLLYLHGEVDRAAPVNGGYSKNKKTRDSLGYMHSAQEIATAIAKNNQCTGHSQEDYTWQKTLGTVCETWSKACNRNSSVSMCIIPKLGHTWPGAEKRYGLLPMYFGPGRPDLKGSQAVIEFFRENKE